MMIILFMDQKALRLRKLKLLVFKLKGALTRIRASSFKIVPAKMKSIIL